MLVLPDHAALHLVLDDGLAGQRCAQPDRRLDVAWRVLRVAVAPHPVIEPGTAFGARLLAHGSQLFRGGIAAIRHAAGEQLLGDLAVARGAAILVDDLAVPIEFEPFQPVQDGVDRCRRRALAVGVLDSEQHLAAAAARIQPVEQRRPGASDMEKAGRGGGKARDDR